MKRSEADQERLGEIQEEYKNSGEIWKVSFLLRMIKELEEQLAAAEKEVADLSPPKEGLFARFPDGSTMHVPDVDKLYEEMVRRKLMFSGIQYDFGSPATVDTASIKEAMERMQNGLQRWGSWNDYIRDKRVAMGVKPQRWEDIVNKPIMDPHGWRAMDSSWGHDMATTSLAVSMGIPKDVYTRIYPAQGKDQSVTTRIISGEEGRLVELTEREDPFVTFQYFGPPKKAGEKVVVDGGEMCGRFLLLGTDTVDGNVLVIGREGVLLLGPDQPEKVKTLFVFDEAKSVPEEMLKAVERKRLLDEARKLYERTPTKGRVENYVTPNSWCGIPVVVDEGGTMK